MELAFDRLAKNKAEPIDAKPMITPERRPLAVANIKEQRAVLLQIIAQQVGLEAPTDLQARTFDTFLGYYEILAETYRKLSQATEQRATVRHLAICTGMN